jgi:NADH-ubiquinone oxidoreductase chain 3
MSSSTIFFYFVPVITILLLVLNLVFAKHNPYLEKDSPFECGYHSFLGQSRTQFTISFFIFGLLFLLFDLEILLVFPYGVSAFTNETMGLIIFIIFFVLLTIGFIFEIGKGALSISSKQSASSSFSTTTYN